MELSWVIYQKTLDDPALRKPALMHRFEQLIAPKFDDELEAMARLQTNGRDRTDAAGTG